MRVTVRAAFLGAWLTSSACYAYRPVALAPPPGSRVRIVFASSIAVTTLQSAPDSTGGTYPGVLEASGTIQAAAGDTVALHLGELRTASGSLLNVSGQVALLPTAQIARIEQRRFQAGTTILAGLGLSFLALSTFIILIMVALTKGI
jgi:hypothetical protein